MERIIIVGAGAAGLMAGCRLAGKDRDVIILEGRDRIGGRMHTISEGFTRDVEEGAEFIHGDLPLTFSILKEAQANYYHTRGRIWRHFAGEMETDDSFIEDDSGLNRKLRELKEDMTVKEFLETHFDPEKDFILTHSIRKFVEGYDSADYSRASAFALRDEWLKDDDSKQYRIAGGYKLLYEHLENKFITAGGKIHLNEIVREIIHDKKSCEIISSEKYTADKVIVTVPTGVLGDKSGKAYIKFSPDIPELENWISKSGYGWLTKIDIEFTIPFWENEKYKNLGVNQTHNMMFLFSDQKIPTWWTQSPDSYPLLTGWLAGTDARKMKDIPDEELFTLAIESLSSVYKIDTNELNSLVKKSHVKNWTNDPFTLGSYSYKTPDTNTAFELMKHPFGSLYFAGEALNMDGESGTVEAALLSSLRISDIINNQ
jgi:monoamine oxidase